MNNFENIQSDFQLNQILLKNRVVLAPMTRRIATDAGLATERMGKYYADFASGDFGLLITEGTYIDEGYSQGYLKQPGLANDNQVEAWKVVTDAVHKQGSKIICQLMHAGALSQGNRFTEETIAPSAVKPKTEPNLASYGGTGEFNIPVEMDMEMIEQVIENYVAASIRAKKAGFDGVEIHGASGYLIDQFLTDYTNLRTDQYGGSTENRVRFATEVISSIRAKVGVDFIVGIRLSQIKANDYTHKWAGGEKDAEVILKSVEKAGVDYIHFNEYDATFPAFNNEGETLSAIAKNFTDVAVIACGKLEEPLKAEALLQQGDADLIALAKGALSNPDWPRKVAEGQVLKPFEMTDYLIPE